MVVDDDTDVGSGICALLSDEGYEARWAGNGKDAFAALETRPADIILLDLRMPVMDGWQFRTIQRSHPRFERIPVIAVSADGSPQAEAIDAAGYLKKPIKAADLLLNVERVLLAEQRKDLTERLKDADRLTTLGTIAASVGHEINNPLTYVINNLQIVQTRLPDAQVSRDMPAAGDPTTADLLQEIRVGVERIRDVVENLRALSRRAGDTVGPVDINAVARTSIAIASNEIRYRARLRMELGEVPHVQGSDTGIGQVLINLLVNAAQSIPLGASERNEIVVRTRSSADEVTIELSDTGTGIPEELQSRVFDPFFTTKPASEGTGIGLTVSKRIVSEHRGRIEVRSTPGAGSTFLVHLPIQAGASPPARQPPRPRGRVSRTALSRRARVLVVDDDPLVLATMERVLAKEHRVIAASSGREAIGLIEAGQRYDAYLCDVLMPDMTGMQFCSELERQRPGAGARVVFTTGAPMVPEVLAYRSFSTNVWLDKPFQPEALVACMSELLARLDPV